MKPRSFIKLERWLIRSITPEYRDRYDRARDPELIEKPPAPRPRVPTVRPPGHNGKQLVLAAAERIAAAKPGQPISDRDLVDATGLPVGSVSHWVCECRHSGEWIWPRPPKGSRFGGRYVSVEGRRQAVQEALEVLAAGGPTEAVTGRMLANHLGIAPSTAAVYLAELRRTAPAEELSP